MTALTSRRRRRSIAMLVTTVVVVALVPVLGYVGVRAILDAEGGTDAIADNLPITPFPDTPTGLLVTNDGEGRMTSATVFVLHPSGSGGSIVSVPVNADFGLSDAARQSLQGAYETEGMPGALAATESLLGVTLNHSSDLDPSALAGMLSPLAPIPVELPVAVAADGAVAEIPAGSAQLSAEQAARVLTAAPPASDDGTPASESARRPNVEEVWVGVARAVGDGRGVAAGTLPTSPQGVGQLASFDELAGRVFAGEVQTRGLTAQALTAEQNPTGIDAEQLDRAEEVMVFASIAPSAMSPSAIGPTFRLVAPPGYDAAVKQTIAKLLFFQANVISVSTVGEPRTDTVFLVPDEIVRNEAAQTDEIFGAFTFGEPEERIEGIDITVLLGTDYLEGVEG